MKLSTVRLGGSTQAVRIDDDVAVELGHSDLLSVLQTPDWRDWVPVATGPTHPVDGLEYATLIGAPDKIICVGLNYREHILEMGRGLPDNPTLFNKFSGALIGAHDPIIMPAETAAFDWEVELGVIIGAPVRRADERAARAAIAGWTVVNDITCRDWQYRTTQWMQGKTFEATTPVGPWLVTSDDGEPLKATVECFVGDERMQHDNTENLVFGPIELIQYISQFITLLPGDIIATGTSGGVGHARKPERYLAAGEVVTTRVDGIGECRNVVTSG